MEYKNHSRDVSFTNNECQITLACRTQAEAHLTQVHLTIDFAPCSRNVKQPFGEDYEGDIADVWN